MKIGIITFHFPHNYGAMLQAYAMQQKLSSMGHETYIIDYAPSYHTVWYQRGRSFKQCFSLSPIQTAKWLTGFFLQNPIRNNRYDAFETFKNKRMNLYPYKDGSNFSEFDAILLGSDQIWDQAHTNNCFDGPYFGEGFACKVFSYAASSKHKSLDAVQQKEFKDRINKLFAIGVREESLVDLLQPLTNKQVTLNLDPTLLVDSKEFSKLNLDRPCEKKYVLIYELNEHPEVIAMAQKYAKNIGAKVVSLVAYFNWKNRFSGLYDQEASPEKFLAYIKNAECVFTSSFHGTALSLVFERAFYTIKQNNNSDLRMSSLLDLLGLSDRFIDMFNVPDAKPIDYDKVKTNLALLRSNSEQFLFNALVSDNPF